MTFKIPVSKLKKTKQGKDARNEKTMERINQIARMQRVFFAASASSEMFKDMFKETGDETNSYLSATFVLLSLLEEKKIITINDKE